MRLAKTEQIIMLSISSLILVSISAVYIRHHDIEQKKQNCRSYVIGSIESAKNVKEKNACVTESSPDTNCPSPLFSLDMLYSAEQFENKLLELKVELQDSEPLKAALDACEQMK